MSYQHKNKSRLSKPLNTNAQEFNFEQIISSDYQQNKFLQSGNQYESNDNNHYQNQNYNENRYHYNKRGNSNNSQSKHRQQQYRQNYNNNSKNQQKNNRDNINSNKINNIPQKNNSQQEISQIQNSYNNKDFSECTYINHKQNSNLTDHEIENEEEVETNDSNKGEDHIIDLQLNNKINGENNYDSNIDGNINEKQNINKKNKSQNHVHIIDHNENDSDFYHDKLEISDSYSELSNNNNYNKQSNDPNTQKQQQSNSSQEQQFQLGRNYEFFYIQHQQKDGEFIIDNFSNPNIQEQLISLGEVHTLYDFCQIYNQFENPSQWQNIHKVALFQENYKPIWQLHEDKGGCIVFKFTKNKYTDILDELWEQIVFGIIGDQMKINDQVIVNNIIGIQLNIQSKYVFLELWLLDSSFKYSTAMVLKKFLDVDDKQPFYFQNHKLTIQNNGILDKQLEKLVYNQQEKTYQTVQRVQKTIQSCDKL